METILGIYGNYFFTIVITERDICDIIIAFNNQDYDWILHFFETLHSIGSIDDQQTYTYEQVIANAGIVSYQGK